MPKPITNVMLVKICPTPANPQASTTITINASVVIKL
jgi:hypothetical protein